MAFTLQGYDIAGKTQQTIQSGNAGKSFLDAMTQIQQVSLARREEERLAAKDAIDIEKGKKAALTLKESEEAFSEATSLDEKGGNLLSASERLKVASIIAADKKQLGASMALGDEAARIETREFAQKQNLAKFDQEQSKLMGVDIERVYVENKQDWEKTRSNLLERIDEFKEKYGERKAKQLEKGLKEGTIKGYGGIMTFQVDKGTYGVKVVGENKIDFVDSEQLKKLHFGKVGGAGKEDALTKQTEVAMKYVKSIEERMTKPLDPAFKLRAVIEGKSKITDLSPDLQEEFKAYMKAKEMIRGLSSEMTKKAMPKVTTGKSGKMEMESDTGVKGKPLGDAIAKSILQETGGDKMKARELAKKRGYDIGE